MLGLHINCTQLGLQPHFLQEDNQDITLKESQDQWLRLLEDQMLLQEDLVFGLHSIPL